MHDFRKSDVLLSIAKLCGFSKFLKIKHKELQYIFLTSTKMLKKIGKR